MRIKVRINLKINNICRDFILRALKPYLVTYRVFGLISCRFRSDDNGKSISYWNRCCGWDVQATGSLLLIVVFFVDRILRFSSASSTDLTQLLNIINRFTFSFNVLFTNLICWSYLSRRLCLFVDRIIHLEKQLESLGCQFKVRYLYC